MKTYKKEIDGIKVLAYNDSGSEWVVKAGDMSTQRFDMRKWTMKEAMKFAAQMAA